MCVLYKSAGYLLQNNNLRWKFWQYCLAAQNQCTDCIKTFFSYRKQQTLTWLKQHCSLQTYKKEFLWLLVTKGQHHHLLHLEATTKIFRCSLKVMGNPFRQWDWPFTCKHLYKITKRGPAVEETGCIKIAAHFVKITCDKLTVASCHYTLPIELSHGDP